LLFISLELTLQFVARVDSNLKVEL